jgi:hypothetical protein
VPPCDGDRRFFNLTGPDRPNPGTEGGEWKDADPVKEASQGYFVDVLTSFLARKKPQTILSSVACEKEKHSLFFDCTHLFGLFSCFSEDLLLSNP